VKESDAFAQTLKIFEFIEKEAWQQPISIVCRCLVQCKRHPKIHREVDAVVDREPDHTISRPIGDTE